MVQVASPKSASGRFYVSSVSVSVSASVSVPSDSAEVFSLDFVSVSAVLSEQEERAADNRHTSTRISDRVLFILLSFVGFYKIKNIIS